MCCICLRRKHHIIFNDLLIDIELILCCTYLTSVHRSFSLIIYIIYYEL